MNVEDVELLNRQVQFRVRDVYHPDPQSVINELFGESVLKGQVVDVTESDEKARFAFVKVIGLDDLVLIAVDKITNVV